MTRPGSTAILEPKVVSDITGRFHVPSYQRGYRWGPDEVSRLLTDILAAGDKPYYLQPIVVKKMGDDHWELVDGQQRLTTLYIILRHIQNQFGLVKIKYSLEYETRPGSAEYLDSMDRDKSQDNIDFFHMFEAHQTVANWIASQANPALAMMNLYQSLSEAERVTLIWYEAPHDVNGPDLFTRLNVGRIPLTDAELVKARLLATTRTTIPGREREVAAQWDAIERDLRVPELWAFISGRGESEASHIGVILDALADTSPDRVTPLYHTFETLRPRIEEAPEAFWNEVVDLHSHIMGWYSDREIYHHIGYLVSRGTTLQQIIALHKGVTKGQFRDALLRLIRNDLKLSAADLGELGYTSSKTPAALLLMNIETVLQSPHSTERYSFHSHAREAWSIEHIHAQQTETLNREPQWREWLRLHLAALANLPGTDQAAVEAIRHEVPPPKEASNDGPTRDDLTRRLFEDLQQRVQEVYRAAGQEAMENVDAIDNLALLASRDNSALNNSVFEVKRRAIIKLDREGAYIPVCTRNVFLKYYTDANAQQIHFWGPADRAGYATAMSNCLSRYLIGESHD